MKMENAQTENRAAGGLSDLTAGLAVVYGSDDNWFFSEGVTRDFGQNKVVKLDCMDWLRARITAEAQ